MISPTTMAMSGKHMSSAMVLRRRRNRRMLSRGRVAAAGAANASPPRGYRRATSTMTLRLLLAPAPLPAAGPVFYARNRPSSSPFAHLITWSMGSLPWQTLATMMVWMDWL